MQTEPAKNLIAVSVERIESADELARHYGFGKVIVFKGTSSDRNFSFTSKSRGLNASQAERYERVARHGFTVMEIPDSHPFMSMNGYPGGWQFALIEQAVLKIEEMQEGRQYMSGYDEALACKVLALLDERLATPITNMELKHLIEPEPSDSELLAVLDVLHMRRLIDGKGLRDHTSGTRQLVVMANITLTKEGYDELRGTGAKNNNVYNNYGQAGAMGPNSSGVVNYRSEWNELQRVTDLQGLAIALQTAFESKKVTADTTDDYEELSLLRKAKDSAEKQDGSRLLQILSLMGKRAVPVLTKAGANGLLLWLEHKTGAHLS